MGTEVIARQPPVGFGRGWRTNRIAVIQPNTSSWMPLPRRVSLWPADRDIDPWVRTALCGFHSAADSAAFALLWHYWRKGETAEEVAAAVFPDEADAAIILAPRDEHAAIFPVLAEMEVPFVVAYARSPDPRYAWADCDNRGGIIRAVQHLCALGHTRIGYLTGAPDVAAFQQREQGFVEGMEAAGLELDRSLLVQAGLREVISEVAPSADRLLRRPDRPTAVVCATDIMALAVIEVAWEMGIRVPDELAVIGFDDSDFAVRSVPTLTTVHQPILEVANRAGYLAACAVAGQEPETGGWQIDIPTELVVRESCGAANRAAPRADAGGEARGEPQRMRRQLEHHMRQLAATQAQMEQLLYVASHDLRAPLITIEGFGTILKRKCWDLLDARGRDCVTRILHSVDNLRKLTDTLLALSRAHRQPLSLQRTNAAEVVARVLRDLEVPLAQRRVQVKLSAGLAGGRGPGPSPATMVMADETALYQIFLNLVGNAVKFLGEQPEPVISITYRRRPDEHEFSVQDNGIGIAPEHQESIFQLFRRGPGAANTEGQGVGLSLAKDLVLRHGGRIWVESEPGRGATFHFTLPGQIAPPG